MKPWLGEDQFCEIVFLAHARHCGRSLDVFMGTLRREP